MGSQEEPPKTRRLTPDERKLLEAALVSTRNYGVIFGVAAMVCFYTGFFLFGAIDVLLLLYMWCSNETIAELLSKK
jgi:hypothetical protein